MKKHQEVGLDHPIGITAIIGSPNCNKCLLLEGLSKTVTFVRGFVFANMDDLLNWRRDLDDKIIGLSEFLQYYQTLLKNENPDESHPFRHLVMTSFPQTEDHLKSLLELCPRLRLAFVDFPGDKDDGSFALAEKFKAEHPDKFISVNAARSIHYQAEHVVKKMDITVAEAKSMKAAIFSKNSSARRFFDEINHPKQKATHLAPPKPVTSKPADRIVLPSQVFTSMRQATC